MRTLLALGAATLAVTAFLPQSQSVTVHAECANGQLGAHSVNPDTVQAAQGADIDWELDDASSATDITVQPKQAGHWPWGHDQGWHGQRGHGHRAHAAGNGMNRNAAGTYPYSIELSCPDGHGGSTSVEIDPTIIVHGG
jgi:hypothetical protein